MKSILVGALSGLVWLAGITPARAQGSVTFNTYNGANFQSGNVFRGAELGGGPLPSVFWGQLYWADSVGGPYTAAGSPQAFSVGTPGTIQAGSVFIPGRDPGTAVQFQLRVWNSLAGATYEAANAPNNPNNPYAPFTLLNTVSQTRARTLAGADSDGTIFPPQQFNTFANFTVILSPEPTPAALGALGVVMIFLFRSHRKPLQKTS